MINRIEYERAEKDDGVHQLPTRAEELPLVNNAYIVGRHLIDVANGETVTKHYVLAVIGGTTFEYDPLDTDGAGEWHVPTDEIQYYRSPQRSLWYASQLAKMEEYEAIPVWEYADKSEVPAGAKVFNTKWVRRIKFNESVKFDKLNPRLCLVGTGMSRDDYETFANYMRMNSLKVVMIVTHVYLGYKFQLDDTNAFQNTPVRDDEPAIYARQAPGMPVRRNAKGEPLLYKLLMCLQGGIQSAHHYDRRKVKALLTEVPMQMATWDKRVFIYHVGPLAGKGASLRDIVGSLDPQLPDIDGKPVGFAIFGTHADDGVGGADRMKTAEYIQGRCAIVFACKLTPWRRPLGMTIVDNDDGSFSINMPKYLQQLVERHLGGDVTIAPTHIMKKSIHDLQPEEEPPEGSLELATHKAMQEEARSLKGALVWGGYAWPQLLAPTNRVCALMHAPTRASFKHAKMALMHTAAFPVLPRFAPAECKSLELASPTKPPFGKGGKEFGLHALMDANREAPRSYTGGDILLGGAVIDTISTRQHHASPDVNASEIHAACTVVAKVLPIRGLLHELGVLQLEPTPCWIDSQSTIFCVNDATSMRRSSWLLGKIEFVHEAQELDHIRALKIAAEDNTADGKTKCIDVKTYWRHMTYTHNVSVDVLRSVYGVKTELIERAAGGQMICMLIS